MIVEVLITIIVKQLYQTFQLNFRDPRMEVIKQHPSQLAAGYLSSAFLVTAAKGRKDLRIVLAVHHLQLHIRS